MSEEIPQTTVVTERKTHGGLLPFAIDFGPLLAFFLTGTEVTLPVYIWGQLRFAAKLPSVLALGTLLLIGSFLLLSVAEFLRRRAERQTRMTGTAHA